MLSLVTKDNLLGHPKGSRVRIQCSKCQTEYTKAISSVKLTFKKYGDYSR